MCHTPTCAAYTSVSLGPEFNFHPAARSRTDACVEASPFALSMPRRLSQSAFIAQLTPERTHTHTHTHESIVYLLVQRPCCCCFCLNGYFYCYCRSSVCVCVCVVRPSMADTFAIHRCSPHKTRTHLHRNEIIICAAVIA